GSGRRLFGSLGPGGRGECRWGAGYAEDSRGCLLIGASTGIGVCPETRFFLKNRVSATVKVDPSRDVILDRHRNPIFKKKIGFRDGLSILFMQMN
ncbi:hypothetical protein ACYOEI_16055, partial [Singulisphaera rosea]